MKPDESVKGELNGTAPQSAPLTADDFRQGLAGLFSHAQGVGETSIEVNSGELHRSLGGALALITACRSVAASCTRRCERETRSLPLRQKGKVPA
ncbi:MAG: hypothetical protein RQM90_15270 [Methanoculleus sp.]